MPLVNGSVSVDSEGNVTGSGFARALYDALADVGSITIMAEVAADDERFESSLQAVKERCAASANALADAINDQIKTATVAVAGVTSGASSAVGVIS